jgi:hypothetical protein
VSDETPNIPDEGKFVQALGLNPEHVVAGSVEVVFPNGTPAVKFTQMVGVTAQRLGLAFLACGDVHPKQPEDHKPPAKKAAAKKAPAKRSTR